MSHPVPAGAGSSVGTSARLKSERSAVRPRPCPPPHHPPAPELFGQGPLTWSGDLDAPPHRRAALGTTGRPAHELPVASPGAPPPAARAGAGHPAAPTGPRPLVRRAVHRRGGP